MENLKALRKIVFYISFPFSLIGFMFPVYVYSKGASVVEIGLIYSAFSLFTILMRPVVGGLIDKKGRKIGIVIGVAFYCIANVLFLLGKDLNYLYLLIGRVLQSIGSSFLWISLDTMISDISNEGNRSENFGDIDGAFNKGNLLGAVIGFNIILNDLFSNSYKVVFSIYLLTSIISLYYAITKIEETVELKKSYEDNTINNIYNFNLFLLIIGVFAFIISMTAHTYLIYVKENITDKLYLISYLFAPGAILSMFLPKKFGKISDKYNREKIMIIGILITGGLFLLIPIVKKYYYFMLMDTLIVIATMLYGPAQSALIIDIVGKNKRGKSYGKYKFAIGIGGMLGPIVGTYIYENLGNAMVFYVKGILLISICILMVKLFNFGEIHNSVKY